MGSINSKSILDWKWFLFSLDGRINRKPFWIFTFSVVIVALFLNRLFGIKIFMEGFDIKSLVFYFIILWPALAVQAKRWHDRNKSAWWVLINVIPIIGPIWGLIENGFLAGTEGANRFGDYPLGYGTMLNHKEMTKPMVTSPLAEKDMARELREAVKVVLATLLVIALVVLGTWFYLSYIKK